MTGFTYEYTNGYINNQTEIRLIKVYNDGVYYFKDWVELDGSSSESDWEIRAEQIMLEVQVGIIMYQHKTKYTIVRKED